MLWKWFLVLYLSLQGRKYSEIVGVSLKANLIEPKFPRKPPDISYNLCKLYRKGLISALNVVARTPKFMTMSDKVLCEQIRQYKSSVGILRPNNVPQKHLPQIRHIMHLNSSNDLLGEQDIFDVIADTGCSNTASAFKEDFIPGSLQKMEKPITISGVGGDIKVEYYGKLSWECITTTGEVARLEHYGHYAPALKNIRLLSPQRCFEQMGDGKFVVSNTRIYIKLGNGQEIDAQMHPETGLPIIPAFTSVDKASQKIAILHNIITPDNKNLTGLQRRLLQWHYKLGHIRFQTLQWIGRQEILRPDGIQWGKSTVSPPICEACQQGKQARKTTKGSTSQRENEGILSKGELQPGDLVFTDQFVSSLCGRFYNRQGKMNTRFELRGGTVFYDAASRYIHLTNQVGFTAYETIESKHRFEREAHSSGIYIKKYCSDNGVYTSKEFINCLDQQNQTIRHSGVGGHHHNGPAENAIKIIINRARTMMFHSAICWPEHTELSLWPFAIQHAVYLYNNTPDSETKKAPIELWTQAKSSYSALRLAQTWGCPAYVLDPRLQDGQKIPKWQPRSKQGQYLGVSPYHASTVGLVRNLRTNNISPQFHVIYDTYFETVHSDHKIPSEIWDKLQIENRFHANYDEPQYLPELKDEWLTPDEIQERHKLKNKEVKYKELGPNTEEDGLNELNPTSPSEEMQPDSVVKPGETVRDQASEEEAPFNEELNEESEDPRTRTERQEAGKTDLESEDPRKSTEDQEAGKTDLKKVGEPQKLRRSSRESQPPTRYTFDKQHGYATIKKYLGIMYKALTKHEGQSSELQSVITLVIDPDYGVLDDLPMHVFTNSPQFFKAGKKHDPDTPTIKEALGGPHRREFIKAMKKEVEELEEHNTWTIMNRSDIPEGANIVPSTWAFKIKRAPSGELKKFKARFCVQGDKQIEGVDYFETYAPVVSWATVRILLCLTLQYGWHTRQVDFSNAFVHAILKEDVYITLPAMFEDESGEDPRNFVLKLNKSLYGLAQSPRSWYYCLREALESLGFKTSAVEPGVFFGHGMTVVCWVDDCLFFGPNQKQINFIIKEIRK